MHHHDPLFQLMLTLLIYGILHWLFLSPASAEEVVASSNPSSSDSEKNSVPDVIEPNHSSNLCVSKTQSVSTRSTSSTETDAAIAPFAKPTTPERSPLPIHASTARLSPVEADSETDVDNLTIDPDPSYLANSIYPAHSTSDPTPIPSPARIAAKHPKDKQRKKKASANIKAA